METIGSRTDEGVRGEIQRQIKEFEGGFEEDKAVSKGGKGLLTWCRHGWRFLLRSGR